ncbi:M48 family metallopeptidase [Roseospirillum parvum]|uniref:Peptidase family M48 n=1 Tax=Roseospirillum parvum TaxID=83401 RepID=A0A1G7YBC2_9PROT|nr:M48 family metallopeptidase [Roseospirillum parvum]SDG93665.1 Peptidase family M48 [Roseospirillum parvum]
MSRFVLALTLGAGLTLGGCQTLDEAGESLGLSDGGPEVTTSHYEEMTADAPTGPCGGDGADAVQMARVDFGLGVVREPRLEAYMNGILKRLVAASPRPDCQARAFVLPNNDFTTVATKGGGILIPLGLLREFKSEDEIAAVLGHELSHILYGHHDSDSFLETQDDLAKGLNALNGATMLLGQMAGSDVVSSLNSTTQAARAVYLVSETVVGPAWTRDQEDQADFLGTDLMTKAGYNPTGMSRVMDVLIAYEKLIEERAEAQSVLDDPANQEALSNSVMKLAEGGATGSMSTGDAIEAAAGLIQVGAAWISTSDTAREHRSAEERKEQVSEYIRQFHRDDRRRRFTEDAWKAIHGGGVTGTVLAHYEAASQARKQIYAGEVDPALAAARTSVGSPTENAPYPRLAFFEVRKMQGRRDKARQNLELAMRDPEVPWSVYRNMAELELEQGRTDRAVATLDKARQVYGDPVTIVPYAITVHRRSGQADQVGKLLRRCEQDGTRAMFQACLTSAQVSEEQYRQGMFLIPSS